MGASTFSVEQRGANPTEAFRRAREDAEWEYGHGGYTGTIAEKSSIIVIKVDMDRHDEAMREHVSHLRSSLKTATGYMVEGLQRQITRYEEALEKGEIDVHFYAWTLIEQNDRRIDDKWGPAGCIEVPGSQTPDGSKSYLFFGWASS